MRDTRCEWSYIFGAVCPGRAATAALALPFVNTRAMALHLAEIARNVAPGTHAVLVLDGVGWQYLHANKLAITVFDSHSDVVEECCAAWNFFAESPKLVSSITSRDWATVIN